MAREAGAVLEAAALAAFEQMGFLLADPEVEPVDGELMGMRVRFRGPTGGAVVVRGDDTLLEALASGMLGAMETPSRELQLDALGEIANVICGNVVPEAEDPASVFRLDAPEPVSVPSGGALRGSVRLGLEGGVAQVDLLEVPS